MDDERLAEIQADVVPCLVRHADPNILYCEDWDCATVQELLDEIHRLRTLLYPVAREGEG